MKKAYLINDNNCMYGHYTYRPYGQEKSLITLGYALIATTTFDGKEKYKNFIDNVHHIQQSFDLRCCFSPEMQISFTRDKEELLLTLEYGSFECHNDGLSESDIFYPEEAYIKEEWSWESQEWIKSPSTKKDFSIKIKQTTFINLAQEFSHINHIGLAIELIQNENGSYSLFYQK